MKTLIFLSYFIVLQAYSCNDTEIYKSILKDIKSSEAFIDYKDNIDRCGGVKVSGYLYSMCFLGSPFVFDYPDISDYLNENCFGENARKGEEYQNLEKLSDIETTCLWVSFSETFNNKIAAEVISTNKNINEELIYLYEILPDKSIIKLEEMVFIVD